jgi:WhiB family redox-sensing transcriptional regulator
MRHGRASTWRHYRHRLLVEDRPGSEWVGQAACLGQSELFFATDPASQGRAQAVCGGCPVRRECLAEVRLIEQPHQRFGVWGGLTPGERDRWG